MAVKLKTRLNNSYWHMKERIRKLCHIIAKKDIYTVNLKNFCKFFLRNLVTELHVLISKSIFGCGEGREN